MNLRTWWTGRTVNLRPYWNSRRVTPLSLSLYNREWNFLLSFLFFFTPKKFSFDFLFDFFPNWTTKLNFLCLNNLNFSFHHTHELFSLFSHPGTLEFSSLTFLMGEKLFYIFLFSISLKNGCRIFFCELTDLTLIKFFTFKMNFNNFWLKYLSRGRLDLVAVKCSFSLVNVCRKIFLFFSLMLFSCTPLLRVLTLYVHEIRKNFPSPGNLSSAHAVSCSLFQLDDCEVVT